MLVLDILMNRLANLNFDAIFEFFEFLGQFTVTCINDFSKKVDNFEIEHKTC